MHICNFRYTAQGTSFYNTDRKISAGFVRNNHFVYDYSLRDMARFSTIFKTKKLGAAKANADVLKVCDHLQPDLVLLGHAQLLTPETLRYIRKNHPDTRIALWYVDPLFHTEKTQYMQSFAPYLDAVFVTTGGELLEQLVPSNVTRAYFPNPVESAVDNLKNYQKRDFEYELMFCGSVGDDISRRQFMQDVQTRLQDLPLRFNGLLGFPGLRGIEYFETMSKVRMGLNHSRRNDVCLYSSDRIAHLTGNGLLALTPKIPEFDLVYRNDDVVYFDTLDDFVEQVRHFRANPDAAAVIAESGWRRAHSTCSTERVARFMEETIFQLPYSEDYEWSSHIFKT